MNPRFGRLEGLRGDSVVKDWDWLTMIFIGIQILIPIVLFVLRWTVADGRCLTYGWQMYACGCSGPGC